MNKLIDPYYIAQSLLSYREHSEFEIRTKMKRKKFTTEQINNVMQKLKKLNLINDNNFSDAFAEQTLNIKPVGPKWLAYKLKQKGIEQSIISNTLNKAYFSGREKDLAKQAAASWKRTHPNHAMDHKRLTHHLASRGFSYDVINSAAS